MVALAPLSDAIRDAAYYARLLEALYTGMEGLDTTGYRWAPSDGWRQARYVEATDGGTAHLETWIDLGAVVAFDRAQIRHESSLTFAARYVPDDDAVAQARIHGAARHASEFLAAFSGPAGERARPTGYRLAAVDQQVDWIAVTLSFELLLPRY